MRIDSTFKNRSFLGICYIACLASIIYFIEYDITWFWAMFIYFHILKLFANNIAMHRYFSHRSFKTGPIRHKILAYISVLLSAKSPVSYAMNHRHHHKYSDQLNDTHSPKNNIWSSFFGLWEFNDFEWFKKQGVGMNVRDLMRDRDLIFIEQNYYNIWIGIILATLLINWKLTLLVLGAAGYFHLAAGMLNTIGHCNFPGSYRRYSTNDNSWNNWIWGIWSHGEGFHNNHHGETDNYNFGRKWWEFDLANFTIRLFFDINNPLIRLKKNDKDIL